MIKIILIVLAVILLIVFFLFSDDLGMGTGIRGSPWFYNITFGPLKDLIITILPERVRYSLKLIQSNNNGYRVSAFLGIRSTRGIIEISSTEITFYPDMKGFKLPKDTNSLTGLNIIQHHQNKKVVMYQARLAPPWFNTSLLLSNDSCTIRVAFESWNRQKIKNDLKKNGFQVDLILTLFSLGGLKTKKFSH
jgi:hypothetical protein